MSFAVLLKRTLVPLPVRRYIKRRRRREGGRGKEEELTKHPNPAGGSATVASAWKLGVDVGRGTLRAVVRVRRGRRVKVIVWRGRMVMIVMIKR